MTAPRWAGLGHAEIATMVAAGPGPAASAGAERAWRDAAAALADVHRELSGQVRGLPGGWSGTAADGVTVALGTLDGWVVSATADAERTADALATQAGLAADLRARMPAAAAPAPPETAPVGPALLDDWAAADLSAGNSAGRAAELMIRYDDDTQATGAPWTGWGAAPVVTHDGTAAASPTVPAPPPGVPPHGTGGDAGPADGARSGTTVFAGIGFGGLTAAVLTGNGRAGVPGARPIDVGGPSADATATDGPRTGGTPTTDTAPGTGDPGAAPASPAGDAGTPGDRDGRDNGGTAVTAAVFAGGALGGAGILIGATIRRERQARDRRSPSGDGDTTGRGTPPGSAADDGAPPPGSATPPEGDTPPPSGGTPSGGGTPSPDDDAPCADDTPPPDDTPDRPGDTTTSGAEHRPPSGDATTSGTRAPSGVPATGAADGLPPSTHDGPVPDGATGDPAPHGAAPTGPDDPTASGAPDRPTSGGPTPGSAAGAQPTGPDTIHSHVTDPRITGHAVAPHCPAPAGPPGPAHHAVTTGDLAVPHPDAPAPHSAATHGAATHGRYTPPPVPPHGDPAVTPAGVPVGAVPAAPPPVAAAVGAPADPRVPAWRLVADQHAVPDDPLEQPDARPDPGVLRPEARWRGRG